MAMARRAQNAKPGKQFANDGPDAALELAFAQAAQRDAEDQNRPLRCRGGTSGITEDRLAYALGRIGSGTYGPTQAQRALGFAAGDDYGTYGQGCGRGATAGDGTTVNRYHTAGCEMALSSDEQAEYRA